MIKNWICIKNIKILYEVYERIKFLEKKFSNFEIIRIYIYILKGVYIFKGD